MTTSPDAWALDDDGHMIYVPRHGREIAEVYDIDEAALIVHRVNTWEGLRGALRDKMSHNVDACAGFDPAPGEDECRTCAKARAALEAAEEKP